MNLEIRLLVAPARATMKLCNRCHGAVEYYSGWETENTILVSQCPECLEFKQLIHAWENPTPSAVISG